MSNRIQIGTDADPVVRMNVTAADLAPGDRIVTVGPDGPFSNVDHVIEPGVITPEQLPKRVPYGTVEVCVFGQSVGWPWGKTAHTITVRPDTPVVIDRPNLTIPGLED